ncbi:hypothetical protein EVAR_37253_1 [Eumeta japonica]|uniref:Uncharacterized protein n=1 Tax=Eumeta variegata TaxID=151549 RepID=A0A4C1WMS1_EUMVA|nr:hypothetical protein EVAR_37253_1 [Eumeta japonica]
MRGRTPPRPPAGGYINLISPDQTVAFPGGLKTHYVYRELRFFFRPTSAASTSSSVRQVFDVLKTLEFTKPTSIEFLSSIASLVNLPFCTERMYFPYSDHAGKVGGIEICKRDEEQNRKLRPGGFEIENDTKIVMDKLESGI